MEELDTALKTAIDMEKKGYDIYTKAAGKTRNKFGRETLLAIAAKELDHIKAIEEFASHNLERAIESIKPKDKKNYVREMMDKLAKQLDEKPKADKDLEQAYDIALDLEKASYDFYKKQASRTHDSKVKKFFEFLMGEENTHYELLSETLQYLTRPGDWFKEKERWIVEG